MKNKVAICTLNGYTNFGNRLQNYALVKTINSLGLQCENLWDMTLKEKVKKYIKKNIPSKKYMRINKFVKFNKYINTSYNKKEYDYYVVGSDQVWNPAFSHNYQKYLLKNIDSINKISYSASFGIEQLPLDKIDEYRRELLKFKSISVREDKGKEIVENITGKKNVEVLVDPTMLLTREEWDKVAKKPRKFKDKKYILNYFLGELSDERRKEIESVAKKYDCDIINILDKNDNYYVSGPSEFIYLEKNAFLICTDSFHSSVFAILYDVPFVVFEREQKNMEKMNSRLETLINKFELKNRKYNNINITEDNINHDYSRANAILAQERKKAINYLKKSLDII